MSSHRILNCIAAGVSLLALGGAAEAVEAKPAADRNLPNDNANFIGDSLSFEVDALLASDGGEACLRRGEQVGVIGLKNNDILQLRVKTGSQTAERMCPVKGGEAITAKPVERMRYELPVSGLEELGAHRSGWTYGMLMVPFKYVLSGDRGMRGASTVGGYMGWRQTPVLGMEYSYIGFVGATVISIQKTENGETRKTDNAGLSAGFGVITRMKGAFQVGGVIGWDMVSRDAGYAGNYKPWASIQVGYSFLQ
ncbi:hypothetical protein [Zoogloea dura]|uniref:Outer membrane protein beta-barrel domain-containing protein n=1 Tax=Zoogloea dura TaxID=2728840 RepID=A0A848G3U8_9RHOO|nr:hypothetical protein [Zoogloea dura]NML25934.1 hypothetical protein [Zoogloea dura]